MYELKVFKGRTIGRFDDGTVSGELGKLQDFVELPSGKFVELSFLQGVPPILANQIKFYEPQEMPAFVK